MVVRQGWFTEPDVYILDGSDTLPWAPSDLLSLRLCLYHYTYNNDMVEESRTQRTIRHNMPTHVLESADWARTYFDRFVSSRSPHSEGFTMDGPMFRHLLSLCRAMDRERTDIPDNAIPEVILVVAVHTWPFNDDDPMEIESVFHGNEFPTNDDDDDDEDDVVRTNSDDVWSYYEAWWLRPTMMRRLSRPQWTSMS